MHINEKLIRTASYDLPVEDYENVKQKNFLNLPQADDNLTGQALQVKSTEYVPREKAEEIKRSSEPPNNSNNGLNASPGKMGEASPRNLNTTLGSEKAQASSQSPYQQIQFEIKKHELLQKADYVVSSTHRSVEIDRETLSRSLITLYINFLFSIQVYFMEVRTNRESWTVQSRYNNFNLLNQQVSTNTCSSI